MPTIRYIKDTYEAATDAMWCDAIHFYYNAVRSDFGSIRLNSGIDAMKKIWSLLMHFNAVS